MGNRRRASRYSKACDNSHSSPISVPISRVASRAFSVRAKCDPSGADRRAISSNSGEIIVRSDEISVRSGEVISRPGDPAVRSGRSFSLNIQGLTESGSHPRQSRQFHSESIVQSLISSSPENPKVNSQELAYISDPDGRLASMESFVGEKFKFIVAIAVVIIAALIVAIIYLATRGA